VLEDATHQALQRDLDMPGAASILEALIRARPTRNAWPGWPIRASKRRALEVLFGRVPRPTPLPLRLHLSQIDAPDGSIAGGIENRGTPGPFADHVQRLTAIPGVSETYAASSWRKRR
jgi:hypothetical protein